MSIQPSLGSKIIVEKLIVTQLIKNFPVFEKKLKDTLQCLQESATGPYTEPSEISGSHGGEYEDDCLQGCCTM
jgi:hypothetical protein